MRIWIDLRWMHPGLAGGIENLARSFVGELLRFDATNHYRLMMPAAAAEDFDLRFRENFTIEAVDGPQAVWRRLRRKLQPSLAGPNPVDDAPDVALSLSGYIVPDLFSYRNLLVFADLQHEYHPEFFSPDVLAERQRVFSTSIEKAERIIAISEHTRQTLLDRYRLRPDRVVTACLAADPSFHAERWQPDRLSSVMRKHALTPGSYLLYPANTWAHKNHLGALEALALLRDRHGRRPLLVLTGASKEGQAQIETAIVRLGLASQVRFLGYCPAEDLPALYRGALALFYPSLFEGFGIPLLEAMHCDCPIVCSDRTSLPEIAGDAGLQVDPLAPERMAAALDRLLGSPALQATLRERGRLQARRFSWRQFTLTVLRALTEFSPPGTRAVGATA